MKGNAGFIGATVLAEAMHRLEDDAERLAEGSEVPAGLLAALVEIRAEVEQIGQGRAPEEAVEGLRRIAELGLAGNPAEREERTSEDEALRVPLERLDALVSATSELWVEHAQLQRQGAAGTLPKAPAERLAPIVRRLQGLAMSMRLQSFRGLFARLERLVADESARAKLPASLALSGGEVEVDKAVLDVASGCLTHLLRNALAHGLEPSMEQRLARGKPLEGRISVAVAHEGERVRIVVEDDGRGLDAEAIARKAKERGLDPRLPPEALIFEAGFSTAPLGALAGRGVGLDAVRTLARTAGGSCEVRSRPGAGCTFVLTLPTQLALQRALLVELGGETYALPVSSVLETARASELPVRRLGQGRWLERQGRLIPFVDAASVLGVSARRGGYAVLLEANGLSALEVDRLEGQEELVFRPLEASWVGRSPVSGATLASSGAVLLRLDPSRLVASTESARAALEAHR